LYTSSPGKSPSVVSLIEILDEMISPKRAFTWGVTMVFQISSGVIEQSGDTPRRSTILMGLKWVMVLVSQTFVFVCGRKPVKRRD
jgi:hypothetical protein